MATVPVRRYSVVVMLTSLDIGGTERQTVELVRRLDPDRFRIHLACFHRRGALLSDVPASIAIETFPVQGFRSIGAAAELLRFGRWCRDIGATLVHTCDLYANIFGLPGAVLAGVRARIGSRRELVTGDKSRLQLSGQRQAYRLAQVIVANSLAAADQLMREGVPAHKVRVIPNGVDPSRFTRRVPARPLRRIAVVANLRAEKGHDVLIDATPRIVAAHPEVEFVFAGDGPQAAALADRARARGVADRIEFLGQCRNVPEILASADLFVLPSRTEALPNAVIEAMAAGLPVVASEVGGLPELITHGVDGWLVPPGHPDKLADAVVGLLDDADLAGRLGAAASEHVSRDFGFGRLIDRMEQLYLEAIEHPSSAPIATTVRA